jgi:ribosomal protein S18 acetylase RimI-like enzyme
MTPIIREAGAEENDRISGLCVLAYGQYARLLSAKEWARMRDSVAAAPRFAASGSPLVAETGGALVGFVAYVPPGRSDPTFFPPGWASVRVLAVHPGWRGMGIGRGLMEECLRRAARDEASHLGLFTSDLSTEARGLYGSLGFVRDTEMAPRYGMPYARYALPLAQPRA